MNTSKFWKIVLLGILFLPNVVKGSDKVSEVLKKAMEISGKIESILPNGWCIKSHNNIITIKRDEPIEWYGTISLPSHDLAYLKAHGFIHSGNYTITLEFFPPMSKAEVARLTEENRRIEQQYYDEHPRPKNTKPLGLPKDVRDSMHHIPNILAGSYSVRLTPFIHGPRLAFFDEQVKKEYSGPKKLDHDFESNPW